MDALERLLSPLAPATFFQEIWEQRHHLVKRQAADYYADLFSIDDLDAVIGLSDLVGARPAELRLIRQQADRFDVRPGPDQTIASLRDVYDAYASGYTVVLNSLER